MRLAVVATLACSVIGLSVAQDSQAMSRKYTDIPAQGLGPALQFLAKERNFQIIYVAEDVSDLGTAGAVGDLTSEEALGQLLNGTGLTFRYLDERTVTVHPLSPHASLTGSDERLGEVEPLLPQVVMNSGGAILTALRLAQADEDNSPQRANIGSRGDAQEQAVDQSRSASSATRLEEVLVTARKREERLRDVPISIAVISNEVIERRGLIGMEDYLRDIPGVNQVDKGAIGNAIVIRGITTSPEFQNFTTGTTVASYFDETPITAAAGMGAAGIDVRPVDIERIEVLRGPQGTTYGSASLSGTMRMIPVKPRLDSFSGRLSGYLSDTRGEGSENSMIQGVVNIPVVANKFALRAVGYRYDESGFYRNIAGIDPATIARAENLGLGDFVRGFVQDDVGRMRSTGGRLAALWQATDKLNLSLNFLTQTIEQDGNPSATAGKFEQSLAPIAPQGRVRGEAGDIGDTEMDLLSLVLNYDLGWAVVTSAASWLDGGSARASALTAGLFPSSSSNLNDFESFTAEARLASQLEGRMQFLAGLFYEGVDDNFFQTLDWPGTENPFGTTPMAIFDITRQLDQRAVFGEVSYDLTDTLTATVGGRYFKYEKNERGLQEGGLFGVPIGTGIANILESSESGSSVKANLSYKPTKDSLLYASWAEGFRLGRPTAGAISALCDTDGDGLIDGTDITIESTRRINSDFLENYEIGAKFALFERRMVVDTAVYHIKWDGLPINTIIPGGVCGFNANAGAATSDGVEFQARLLVADGLRLDFGGSYTEAELSKDAPGLFAQAGARLPGSPEVSANLAAQYDFEVFGYKAFVRADSFYAGTFFGNLQETPVTKAGDYIKVDARVGVEIKNLSVELFVRNLTDEDAFTWRGSFDQGEFFGYRLRPRTVGIQIGYSLE